MCRLKLLLWLFWIVWALNHRRTVTYQKFRQISSIITWTKIQIMRRLKLLLWLFWIVWVLNHWRTLTYQKFRQRTGRWQCFRTDRRRCRRLEWHQLGRHCREQSLDPRWWLRPNCRRPSARSTKRRSRWCQRWQRWRCFLGSSGWLVRSDPHRLNKKKKHVRSCTCGILSFLV